MIVLLCYEDDEHAPPKPEGREGDVGFQRVTVIAIF
jgi:hypothetical protein